MKRTTMFKRASLLAIALSMSVTAPGLQSVLPVLAQGEREAKSDVTITGFSIKPALSKIDISFAIPEGAGDAVQFDVYRGSKADKLTKIGTALRDGKTATYTDTNNVKDKIYFYQIKASDASHAYASDILHNDTAAGIDSIANAKFYKDLSDVNFDNSTMVTLTDEELSSFKDLSRGQVLIKATPKAGVTHTQMMFMAKPSADAAGANNRMYAQLSHKNGKYLPTMNWAPKAGGNIAYTSPDNADVPAGKPYVYAFGFAKQNNRVFQAFNGTPQYFSNKTEALFNSVEGLDQFTIGGWMNGTAPAPNYFEGKIDWIAVSDELTSTDDIAALTGTAQSDTEFAVRFNSRNGAFSGENIMKTSQAQALVFTIPTETPQKEDNPFLYWQDADGNHYAPGEKVIVEKANPELVLSAQYTKEDPAEPIVLPELKATPGYARVTLSIDRAEDDANVYEVLRSEEEEGTYAKVASLTGDSVEDPSVSAEKTYFYKLRVQSESEVSKTALEVKTGRAGFIAGGEVSQKLAEDDRTFDGNRVIDLEKDIDAVKAMTKGSGMIRFKASRNQSGVKSLVTLFDSTSSSLDPYGANNMVAWSIDNGKVRGNLGNGYKASGLSGLYDDNWHTLVFFQNPDAGNTLTAALDGQQAMQFNDASKNGWFSLFENADSLQIGGIKTGDTVNNGFIGEIDEFCLSSEVLTLDQAKELSKETGFPIIRNGMFTRETGNTWLFIGGREVEGGFDETKGIRNFTHQFEEHIRWGGAKNEGANREEQKLVYSRYVGNGAASGDTLAKAKAKLAHQIDELHPKAISYMPGREDIDSYKAAENKEEWLASFTSDLSAIAETASALKENKGYFVLQTPHAYAEQADNEAASVLAEAMKDFKAGLSEEEAAHVVVVDHYTLTNNDDFKANGLTEGELNAVGHYHIAKQLCDATYGSSNMPYNADSLDDHAVIDKPVYKALEGTQKALSADFGGDTLSVSAASADVLGGSEWTLIAKNDDLSVSHAITAGATVELPVSEGNWKLTLVSADGATELPSLTISKGDSSASAYDAKPAYESLSANQKKLADLVKSDEPLTWLFIGDSITHGAQHTYGYDSISQSFQKFVHHESGLNRKDDLVYNTAISGAIARDTLTEPHTTARITGYTPDVAVMMLGMNDSGQISVSDYKTHMQTNIDNLKKVNPDVQIVLRVPNTVAGRNGQPEINEAIRELAQTNDVILADHGKTWDAYVERFSAARTAGAGNLNRDALHPTGIGQKVMLDDLLKAMGFYDESSELCRLEYKLNQTEKTSDRKVTAAAGIGTLSVDLNSLFDNGEVPGTAEVSVTVDGSTFTKTYDRAAEGSSTTLTFTGLPTGKSAVVSAKVSRYDAAEIITFADSDPIDIPAAIEDVTVELAKAEGGYSNVTLALANESETLVTILRADSEDGEFETIGTTNEAEFRDRTVLPEKTYFYKAQWTDSSTHTTEAISVSTGMDVYKQNAPVYKDLAGQTFDGNTVIDFSEEADTIGNMPSGSIFFRFKTDSHNEMAMIYGKVAGETTRLHNGQASSYGSDNRHSIHLKKAKDNQRMWLRNDFSYTRAEGDTADLADGQWHNVVIVSNPGTSKTFCWYIDGEMIHEFDGAQNGGLFTKLSGMNQLTIGGYYNGESSDVVCGFEGAIRDVIFSNETLNTDQGKAFTAEAYEEEEPEAPLEKSIISFVIDYANNLSGIFKNKGEDFDQAVKDAQDTRDTATDQDAINNSTKSLAEKLYGLRRTPDEKILEERYGK